MKIFRTKDTAIDFIFFHYHGNAKCKKAISDIDNKGIAKIDGIIIIVDEFDILA